MAHVSASFNLSAATRLVSRESTNPGPPYATWANAATNIQDAVDAAKDGDTVRVTNGVYAVGGKTNEWGSVNTVPSSGVGNITGPPLFMDFAAGGYRL